MTVYYGYAGMAGCQDSRWCRASDDDSDVRDTPLAAWSPGHWSESAPAMPGSRWAGIINVTYDQILSDCSQVQDH